ncbi:MAG: 2-C-methyl-D-erythritol 4-phosphate cytidylyltransferase [Candidatus Thiodiazotropha sp.]
MSDQTRCRFWAVVPAAGVGRRLGGDIPKQYRMLADRRVIDHSLAHLLAHPLINTVFVALSEQDTHWPDCDHARDPRVVRVSGGEERCHSVLNALRCVAEQAAPDDWVLVHDAARPCLAQTDLARLIDVLRDHPVGGLLGIPVSDTIKEVDATGQVTATRSRERLWRAFTPQMFRLGLLLDALERVVASGGQVTDEAGAVEAMGHQPLMVEGSAGNIKVTRPEDLVLAEFYL